MKKKLFLVLSLLMTMTTSAFGAGCSVLNTLLPTGSSSSEDTVCEHVYDNDCDVDCNVCSEPREVSGHAYDNACDVDCNTCGDVREVGDHVYDNACDTDCNVCGGEREVNGHVYDDACDEDCNVCGDEREVGVHVYDNACDTDCNECGDEREVGDHVYDNACDTDCNECGDEREVGDHVYDNACDVDCNECGDERAVGDHVYDDACDVDCNVCGDERAVGDHVYDNACDTNCNVCGDVREVSDHVYDNACDTDCNECGDEREVGDHVYTNACDVDCNECGDVREVGDHVYTNACDVDCNECGNVREVGDHVYDNACDTDCNVCGGEREVGDHVYDNACDTNCNECGNVREVGDHVYDNDSDADCNSCGTMREIVTLVTRQDIDLDLTYNNGLVLSNDNVTLDISEVTNMASIVSVKYNGNVIEGANYADGKLSLAKATFGTAFGNANVVMYAVSEAEAEMVINVPVLLITKAISNAEELDGMYAIADALDYNESTGKSYAFNSDGYFVFDQNIAYHKAYTSWPTWDAAGGKWRDAANNGFKGTIDGRGYTIDGLEISANYNAFVTLLNTKGTIKNLGFNNAKLTGVASALVCVWGGGTIENVYVHYAAGAWGAGGGYNGTFFAADNVRGITENNGLTIRDCFVDVSAITERPVANGSCGWMGYFKDATINYVNLQGVFAMVPTVVTANYVREFLGENEVHGAFATAAEAAKKEAIQAELATWNTDYWTIVNGVPTWKTAHVYDNLCDAECNECGATRVVSAHIYENECDDDCNICGATRAVTHTYDNACDKDCNACGYEREVGNHVFDDENDVDCNECGVTKSIITLATRQDIDLDLTYNNGLVLSGDNATLNLSEVTNMASLVSVTYNGNVIEGANYADGKLSLAKATFGTAFGEAVVVVKALDNNDVEMVISVPVLLITKAISNAEELDGMYAIAEELDVNESGKSYAFNSDGLFVLDQNIAYNKAYTAWPTWDAAGGKWRDAAKNGFKGTIDGRGYTIDGLEISSNFNAFVTLLHTNGTIKNLGFKNAKLTGVASALVCVWGGGTIENVYVHYAAGAWGASGGYNGTFFAADNVRGITENNGLTIRDCFVDVSAITERPVSNGSCGWMGYFKDATINYVNLQGVFAMVPTVVTANYVREFLGENEVHGAFATAAEAAKKAAVQAELATWNTDYWTIVNGVPTWNSCMEN